MPVRTVKLFVRGRWTHFQGKFRANPERDALRYLLVVVVGGLISLVCFLQPVLWWWASPCEYPDPINEVNRDVSVVEVFPFRNPLFDASPCRRQRFWILLGLSPWEADLGRRVLVAMILGAIVGNERRSADRPAGIRTNACTAIGASCFTICSIFAFESGSMKYDASRSAAAIPTGVTFLSSAIIIRIVDVNQICSQYSRLHGVVTAAAVWVSAAIGVAAGGGMFWAATACTVLVVIINHFGPLMQRRRRRQQAAENARRFANERTE